MPCVKRPMVPLRPCKMASITIASGAAMIASQSVQIARKIPANAVIHPGAPRSRKLNGSMGKRMMNPAIASKLRR